MTEKQTNSHPRRVALSHRANLDQAAIYSYSVQFWGIKQAETYLDFLSRLMQALASVGGAADLHDRSYIDGAPVGGASLSPAVVRAAGGA